MHHTRPFVRTPLGKIVHEVRIDVIVDHPSVATDVTLNEGHQGNDEENGSLHIFKL